MLSLIVGTGSDCSYSTITEAINSVPYNTAAHIHINEGIYAEKIVCEKKDLLITGDGIDKTIIKWADGALHSHKDGTKLGTFRTYTAFFGGENITVKDMSILNTAGSGKTEGQAISVYADAAHARFENVRIAARQDSLFCSPLPRSEKLERGFFGPRAYTERVPSRQIYRNCIIEGDVDFIFGGADVLFENCEIISLDDGYVTAPSTLEDGLGFVFYNCRFLYDNRIKEKPSCFLGRPWRAYGKTILINCFVDDHIKPEGWDFWSNPKNKETCFFAEYESSYPENAVVERVTWAKELTKDETEVILKNVLEFYS